MFLARVRRRRATLASRLLAASGGSANVAGMWLYGVNATLVTGTLSSWGDANGGSPTLAQGTASKRPADSGSDYVFDGVDDFVRGSFAPFSQPVTLFLVAKQVSYNGGRISDGFATFMLIQQTGGGPTLQQYAGTLGATNSDLAIGTYGVLTSVFNGASSSLRVNEGSVSTADAGTNGPGGLTLGQDCTGASGANVAYKAAVVCRATLSSAQASAVRSLLYSAYGIVP